MGDAATSQDGSRMPRWLEEFNATDLSHYNNREEFNAAVSDILQLFEKGRAGGRKFKWLCGLLAVAEAGLATVGGNK
ncbi:hypothetical protein BHE74_00046399 [Ensete ventricosum]|nr:hypothetical protein BHE74_00046399 [Ensete ventricosum]